MYRVIPLLLAVGLLIGGSGCGSSDPAVSLGSDSVFVAVEFPDSMETIWYLSYTFGYSIPDTGTYSWIYSAEGVFRGRLDFRLPLNEGDGSTLLELWVRRLQAQPEPSITARVEHADGSAETISLGTTGSNPERFYYYFFPASSSDGRSYRDIPLFEDHRVVALLDTTGMIHPCEGYNRWFLGVFGEREPFPLGSLAMRRALEIVRLVSPDVDRVEIGMPSVASIGVGHPLGATHAVLLDGKVLEDQYCNEVEDPPGCFVGCSMYPEFMP